MYWFAYYVPGTILGTGEKKTDKKIPTLEVFTLA